MNVKSLWLCVMLLILGVVARADESFFTLDGKTGFKASDGAPDDVFKNLKRVQASGNGPIKCLAFTPDGDWVILFGTNGFYSNNLKLPVCQKLKELQSKTQNFKSVAFNPTGGWVILWDVNGSWTEGAIPDSAFNRMQELAKQGSELRSITFGPNGCWIILCDKAGAFYENIPTDLVKVVNNAIEKQIAVRCVAFSGTDWICLLDNGWSTSNPDLPSTTMLTKNFKPGSAPRWIAIKPELPAHNFEKFAQIVREELDGKLAGGYAFAVLNQGDIAAQGAEGWARAAWEKEHPEIKWTTEKPMGIGSASKTVTAVALLKLWEESKSTARKFSLDEPFWPRIKSVCPTASDDVKRVTIRQLLAHRSGFKKVDDCTTPQELEKLLKMPLASKRGAVYQDQNNNYYVLRLVIEQISGAEYTPYVKEHVLKPLGITRMDTHCEAEQPTCAYLQIDTARPGFPFDTSCDATAGAVGWYASVEDMARFLAGIRKHKVLSPQTTQLMFKEHLGWDVNDAGNFKVGLWERDEGTDDGSRAGQLGSVIAHFPDGIDAVMLMNCEPPASIQDLIVRAWREDRDK